MAKRKVGKVKPQARRRPPHTLSEAHQAKLAESDKLRAKSLENQTKAAEVVETETETADVVEPDGGNEDAS